jgi:hypothetical protein
MDVGIKTANDQFQTVTTTQRGSLSPTVGQCVWDSDLRQLMVYMNAAGGNAWQPIGNVIICASTTRPSSPYVGQRIFETDTKRCWTYIGSAFVPDDLVFTNEAARDAAITAPFEGQVAYLTTPTIPAATGSITAVPTGIQTIYNGSVWVCVTEVGARSETSTSTTQTSFSTTLADGSTALSVTLVTGTSALVSLSFTVSTNGFAMRMAAAISGASTIAATEGKAILHQDLSNASAVVGQHGMTFVFTGLTAGTNTFTAQYKTSGGTGYFNDGRSITVKGIA